ncbi:MAG: flagellar hook-length control protein FliK, partial [Campylobacterota bacterium]|nr:flagellar hook-length control protein FliK [Campylobacterota bacterium]
KEKETPKPQIAQNVKEKETPKPQIAQNVKEKETPKPQIAQNLKEKTTQESEKPQSIATSKELPALQKETKQRVVLKADDKNQEIHKTEERKAELPKQLAIPKETPLFKAQTQREHTTEQLVNTKAFKTEEKTPKTRANETLQLLLRGEKVLQTNSALTADFSVATARVIAPTATSEATKSLESLLRNESSETPSSASKTDGLTSLKADSFEVKLNEAKQMIKYLSQDVKTAIEDYKSPFTRVKVQLNPQKLGDVDLTIVQRGKNLHITLSSNTAAINTLSMNANELRVQLNNNGINNASLNFNSQDSSNSQAGQQEQHRQKEQQAGDEYSYFHNEEHNEEILSSLEIVVPHYA